jgi:hypothetical protein
MSEAKVECLRAGNTAPRHNEISPPTIILAWPLMGKSIDSLFSHYLYESYHQVPFQNAIRCVIEKLPKRDRSSLHPYQLIFLLSVLGKVLKRVFFRC